LKYLPYGRDFPVDTGAFFIPVSALLLISHFGAAIAGWRTSGMTGDVIDLWPSADIDPLMPWTYSA
jgi:hypothetical protein